MANLEHGVPITADSIFRTGSIAKQFTAMAVAILAERGELDLDADVHEYLPELMDYGTSVTVRQMVHHVAGMGDYGAVEGQFLNAVGDEFRWGNEDYLSIAEFYEGMTTVPLAHGPETKYQYSNYAYFLLSQVVERASGQTLSQFAATEIFGPLGMDKTQFYDDANRIVPNRADGYRALEGGGYEIFMTNLAWVGDGGVYTSINEFLKWDQNFYGNVLGEGGEGLIETVETPHAVRPSDDVGYGFGMNIRERNGHRQVVHTGGWVAFSAYYSRFPDLGLSVATFCNSTDASGPQHGNAVVSLYLGE